MAQPISIFISAGEASGDLYGSLLIQAMSEKIPSARFYGCGGEKMRQAGCETLVDARDVTMVGIVEVVPGLPRVWRAFRRLVASFPARRPSLAVLIDFPDFNLRLAKKLKCAGVEVVYFIAPQVWAWRKGRLQTLRRYVDRLLCIFPFEEKYFRDAGIQAEFVGHPLIGRVGPSMTASEFRSLYGISDALPLIAFLPGSRRKEIQLNLPPMLETAQALGPGFGYLIAVGSPEAAAAVRGVTSQRPGMAERFTVIEGRTYDAVAHTKVAVVASGTATVETALLGTPMVVVYRVTRASWVLGRRLVDVPFFSMVNLVLGREVVRELIQDDFQPQTVAAEVRKLLSDEEARNAMLAGLRELAGRLRAPGISGPEESIGTAGLLSSGTPAKDAIARSVVVTESLLRAEPL